LSAALVVVKRSSYQRLGAVSTLLLSEGLRDEKLVLRE
jgi:hypothetical protein